MTTQSAPVEVGRQRRVDWLELFFDLVFVVIVKQLTDLLHGEPGPFEFLVVAGLLLFAWTAWLNVTTFTNITRAQDIHGRRVAILVAMAGIGLVAVSIPEALGDSAPLLVIGLAIARVAMWPLWLQDRRRRGLGLLRPTVYGPGIAALWIASLLIPEPMRPYAWLVLVVVELVINFAGITHLQFSVAHAIERVGLFTMIVLGESVVELILAVDPAQSPLAWLVTAESFALVCGLFWIYFQSSGPIAESVLPHRSAAVLRDVIGAAHYVIVLGLIGVAAGLGAAIEHGGDGRVPFMALAALCGGLLVYYLANIFIGARYGIPRLALLVLGPLSVVIPIAVLLLGAGWPPWVVVLVLIADVAMHGWFGSLVVRKIPDAGAQVAG
jgi:low temperature requirement protein LtrA